MNRLYDDLHEKVWPAFQPGQPVLPFGEDSSYCLLCSLEVLDEEGNLKRKADMFTKRTIRPHEAGYAAWTPQREALAVSHLPKKRG